MWTVLKARILIKLREEQTSQPSVPLAMKVPLKLTQLSFQIFSLRTQKPKDNRGGFSTADQFVVRECKYIVHEA